MESEQCPLFIYVIMEIDILHDPIFPTYWLGRLLNNHTKIEY